MENSMETMNIGDILGMYTFPLSCWFRVSFRGANARSAQLLPSVDYAFRAFFAAGFWVAVEELKLSYHIGKPY